MDNQHLIGQVMLDKINGSTAIVVKVNQEYAKVEKTFTLGSHTRTYMTWIPLSRLTTNPALVVQSVG